MMRSDQRQNGREIRSVRRSECASRVFSRIMAAMR
jgi:hypothetical protein